MAESVGSPVIVLGGAANALSVARSLGRRGIQVFTVNYPEEHVRHSRYATWIPLAGGAAAEDSWARFLIGPESDRLAGAVLLACSDAGIEIIATHRDTLAQKFILDESNPDAQRCMLNKLCTYRTAQAAGVPTPRYWEIATSEDLAAAADDLVFPLIVKPHLSHRGEAQFQQKFFTVSGQTGLRDIFGRFASAGIDVMLVEKVPGRDDRCCSYYTYLERDGTAIFDFTKRILRRAPANMGGASYHITDWNPEVRDLSLKLLRAAGLRGLANVEFKRDPRDGTLKLMECNARFTAANDLVIGSGYDLPWFVYCRLTGRDVPTFGRYAVGRRMWDPVRDLRAFLDLRRRRELSFWRWIGSIAHPATPTFFQWNDPLPSLVSGSRWVSGAVTRRLRGILARFRPSPPPRRSVRDD